MTYVHPEGCDCQWCKTRQTVERRYSYPTAANTVNVDESLSRSELYGLKKEYEALKAKVREICKLAKCCDGCSNEEYLQLWKDLEEMAK
jgi:hypothetical protein